MARQKWVAIDSNSLRNTITNFQNNQKNFVSMISLFNQDSGIILNLKLQRMPNL
ncbi:MAG: hypothetical protein MGG11_06625 [Trichodesmium sp. MAG_R03]|nr:hypothetical protein [Trichodesmium sp. MAG_R03]